jgi:mannan endo-1,6-alpha-mannosidase
MSLLIYWFYAGDDQYNDLITEGMQYQAGENGDYLPAKYKSYLVRFFCPLSPI